MLDYFFKKVDVHLCPEVKGRITDEGRPVEGLKILRQLMYNDFDEIREVVYTDGNGEFYFPEKIISLPKRRISFQHNSTLQAIAIEDKEKRYRKWDKETFYRLWQVSMRGISQRDSFKQKLNRLYCDINNKQAYFLFEYDENMANEPKYRNYGLTICRWEEDFFIEEIE